MLKVLGKDRYDFFSSKLYEYCMSSRSLAAQGTGAHKYVPVYAEADVKWFSSLGLTLIRIAINHRHLNDDLDPYVIKQEGFKLIDRVIELVRQFEPQPWT